MLPELLTASFSAISLVGSVVGIIGVITNIKNPQVRNPSLAIIIIALLAFSAIFYNQNLPTTAQKRENNPGPNTPQAQTPIATPTSTIPTSTPLTTQRDPYTIEKPLDVYIADFSKPQEWEGDAQLNKEWQITNGKLVYTNRGNSNNTLLLPVDIKVHNYAIDFKTRVTFPEQFCANGGVLSRGTRENLVYEYMGGLGAYCDTTNQYFAVGDSTIDNPNNFLVYKTANVESAMIALRLEVRETTLTLYINGSRILTFHANALNYAHKAGIFANNLKSMQVDLFKVEGL